MIEDERMILLEEASMESRVVSGLAVWRARVHLAIVVGITDLDELPDFTFCEWFPEVFQYFLRQK